MAKANKNVVKINEKYATADNYLNIDLKIKSYDDETKNLLSTTFGVIKNNILEAFWFSVGLEPNVNNEYTKVMTDPNQAFEAQGRVYFRQTGVGNLHPYTDAGNPSGGCFSMHAMA